MIRLNYGYLGANTDFRNGGQMSTRIPSEEDKSCSKSHKQTKEWKNRAEKRNRHEKTRLLKREEDG